jgi:hypothetical protein
MSRHIPAHSVSVRSSQFLIVLPWHAPVVNVLRFLFYCVYDFIVWLAPLFVTGMRRVFLIYLARAARHILSGTRRSMLIVSLGMRRYLSFISFGTPHLLFLHGTRRLCRRGARPH